MHYLNSYINRKKTVGKIKRSCLIYDNFWTQRDLLHKSTYTCFWQQKIKDWIYTTCYFGKQFLSIPNQWNKKIIMCLVQIVNTGTYKFCKRLANISGLNPTGLISTLKQKAHQNHEFVIMSLPFTVCQKINSDANMSLVFWVGKKTLVKFLFFWTRTK